jgi:hypothetical protein
MTLPVAAAVPLAALLTFDPSVLANATLLSLSPKVLFGFGTLAGLPVAICAALIASSAFRRRWRRLVKLVGLTLLITVVIGAGWLWFDMRSMPAIEHYERSGWELVILVGAYAVGAGAILAWFGRKVFRLAWRPKVSGSEQVILGDLSSLADGAPVEVVTPPTEPKVASANPTIDRGRTASAPVAPRSTQ